MLDEDSNKMGGGLDGDYADALGDWARAARAGDTAAQREAFERMNDAPDKGEPGWDASDGEAQRAMRELDTAKAGVALSRRQEEAARTDEGREFAREHRDAWQEVYDRGLAQAADRF